MMISDQKKVYRVELWDKRSSVNGVAASDILASRADIPNGGAVYLVYRGQELIYFQPHAPGVNGITAMSDTDALRYADEHVTLLACADLPVTAAAAPIPASQNAAVVVTAALPVDTPDAEVTFQVEGGQAFTEPVTNGQATHTYAFAAPGTYRIAIASAHHGTTWVEVPVQ